MPEPTHPNQHFETSPNNERFSNGSVTLTEHEMGMDTLVVPMLDADIERGDFIVIPGDQAENPNLPEWGGRRAIAELELGGWDDGKRFPLPSQKLLVLKMDPDFKQKLSPRVGADFEDTIGDDGYLLLAFGKDSVVGMAYVSPTTHVGVVGRKTNLTWLNQFGKDLYKDSPEKWSPFGDNISISRMQFTVGRSVNDGSLNIQGHSENSRTHLRTRASKRQQQILSEQTVRNETARGAPEKRTRRVLGRTARR